MAEKTYNTGRVVGWSNYEEFIKETGYDPNVITNHVYNTLVTYGVTRVVTLPVRAYQWQAHVDSVSGETEPTFYTTTVRVPGASWGAIPIVGIDYDTYFRSFYSGGNGKYAEAKSDCIAAKQALEKAIGNIFTCYISDSTGKRTENSLSGSGYITFAAYPDIFDLLSEMEDYIGDFSGLKLIVRGLSLEDLNIDNLYFGPQGLLFAGNGLVEDCRHETVDISGLSLAANGYMWFSSTGNAISDPEVPYSALTRPAGEVIVNTSGYIDMDWAGDTQNSGQDSYLFTAAEIRTIFNSSKPYTTHAEAFDVMSTAQQDEYDYMIYGNTPKFTQYPDGTNPLYVFPVRKRDGRVSVGDYSELPAQTEGKFKKPLTFVSEFTGQGGATQDRTLVVKDKVTSQYFGGFWSVQKDIQTGQFVEQDSLAVSYYGSNQPKVFNQLVENQVLQDSTFYGSAGRQAWFKLSATAARDKIKFGDTVLISHQTADTSKNAIYQCTLHPDVDGGNYLILNRRGAFIPTQAPSWSVMLANGHYLWSLGVGQTMLDSVASSTAVLSNGVVTINGNRIYPNEVIAIQANIDSQHIEHPELEPQNLLWGFARQTIINNSPKIIYNTCPAVRIRTSGYRFDDPDAVMDSYIMQLPKTHCISITKSALLADLRLSQSVYTSQMSFDTFAMSDEISPGVIIPIYHNSPNTYGYHEYCHYMVIAIDSSNSADAQIHLASDMLFKNNPNLYEVAGFTSRYNPAVPKYHQYDEYSNEVPPSHDWAYDMRTALSRIPASQLFTELGLDIADYVDEAFQNISLGKFLQECTIRTTLASPPSQSTLMQANLKKTYYFYSRTDLGSPSSSIRQPTAQNPMTSSVRFSAETKGNFFATAYYTVEKLSSTGAVRGLLNINSPDMPIWATIAQSRFGEQVTSVSLVNDTGTQLELSGSLGVTEADKITWLDLLTCLGSGKSLDILKGMTVHKRGTAQQPSNYIETVDGIRLYISRTAPDPNAEDIPVGSLGIGW